MTPSFLPANIKSPCLEKLKKRTARKFKISGSLVLLFSIFHFYAIGQQVIRLYENKAPGSENWNWTEQDNARNMFNTRVVYNVTDPSLTVFLPRPDLATGTAVIIAPGGAFHTLSIESEGFDVAQWLNEKGVAAFVLKYRVARSFTDDPVKELMGKMGDFKALDEENAPIIPLAMQDGLHAVQYVRSHAKDYDIDPQRIGFMGFSAGGTLTMSVVYNANAENRPNFVAPIYAYENAIIGSEVPMEKTPIFVAAASDDQLGLSPHSVHIYEKWFAAKQPAELHLYEKGGHGFGMRKQKLPSDQWIERFGEWLKMQGFLKKLRPNKYEKLYGQEAVAEGRIREAARAAKDFAYREKYSTANQKLPPPKRKEKRVVLIGNSITEGWAKTDSAFFAKNNAIGRGISAQTSQQLLLRFRPDVLNLKPKAVVIHIGTNDIAENAGPYDPEFTVGNIASMAELAKANGIKVILASVLPATGFPWRPELGDPSAKVVELNEMIQDYARKNKIPYLDYHTAMKNERNGLNPDLAEDGIHPTLKGFKIMGDMAEKAIAAALKKR